MRRWRRERMTPFAGLACIPEVLPIMFSDNLTTLVSPTEPDR